MAINLKAITSTMGYQQITSLSSSTALTVPQKDLGWLALPVLQSLPPKHKLCVGVMMA